MLMARVGGFRVEEISISKTKSQNLLSIPHSFPHTHFFSQILTSGTGELGAESQLLKISLKITSSAISASVVWEN